MSLQGNLSGFTLAEIFRMISFSAKTGNLVVARDSAQGRVHFLDGEVYFASTPENRRPLGTRMVDAGVITRENLDAALAEQRAEPRKRLGDIVVASGLVARDTLSDFVREQIQDALFEIFEWDDGTYYFEPAENTDEDIGMALSVDEIVVEAERRRHEWDQIRKVLPSMDCSVRLSINAVALAEPVELEPQEWAAICQIADGASLLALRSYLHMTSLALCRMISRMITRGVLETGPTPVMTAQPEIPYEDAFRETIAVRGDEESSTNEDIESSAQAETAEPLVRIVPDPEDHAFDDVAAREAEPEWLGENLAPEDGLNPAVVERAEDAAALVAGGEAPVEEQAPEDAACDAAEETPSPVAAIRKYIREASAADDSERRRDYPIEWLTYYGRLNHRRSKGPSEAKLNNPAYHGAAADKS